MRLTQSQRGKESELNRTDEQTQNLPCSYFTLTLWLSELVEDHDVVGIIEVFSKSVDVLTGQPVGHEDRRPVSVCPVDTILKHRQRHCFNLDYTHKQAVRGCRS